MLPRWRTQRNSRISMRRSLAISVSLAPKSKCVSKAGFSKQSAMCLVFNGKEKLRSLAKYGENSWLAMHGRDLTVTSRSRPRCKSRKLCRVLFSSCAFLSARYSDRRAIALVRSVAPHFQRTDGEKWMALDKSYIDRSRIVVRGRNRTPARTSARQGNARVDMQAL